MKKALKISLSILVLVVIYVGFTNFQKLVLISGYSAKSMASGVFVAGMSQELVEAVDNGFSPVSLATNKVDFENKMVATNVFGFKSRTSVYREGLGAVVINEDYDENAPYLVPKRNKTPQNSPFPYGNSPQKDTVFSNIDYQKLTKVVDNYFNENTSENTTRALLVIYKNQIIAEKYAEGFNENSRLIGWSMGKSLMSAVCGVLNFQGKLTVEEPAPIDAWKNDERAKITINNLLQMNSGLEWEEDYTKISDVTKMLYLDTDMTKSQINKPLVGTPNETWNYSSGTSNLLSGIIRTKFKTHQAYLDFWYTDLFDKIGMHSMIFETDLAGNYVASSYGWSTARDWAKFGLLYLNKGNWNGEQVFSEDWVNYTKTPTNESEGVYGAQFWLNAGGHLPDVPKDLFFADGYQGQRVFIIPSKELVVVRLGVTYSKLDDQLKTREIQPEENKDVVEFELNNQSSNELLKDILSVFK
ncbi:CubicO group peptidase, beta-lactamase class C family [Lutibacter agarilyticus]|uniref:CubicO group peptidase, beta-lactamase class C family n=1 Tax=Lutibacter agarilyticus TaxID=1109740 RepID=A0A238W6P2_9FLAO|nr:serine hydrolase [Lutibacter agarilyticus]SNR42216.1 CubicO group peptidase, beta-lactamase class C family [Lutibacter agarilyticus]